ncbi:unnamed protein product [Aphanomyces euteiches]
MIYSYRLADARLDTLTSRFRCHYAKPMHRSFTLVVLVSVATVAFHLVDDGPSVSSYTRLQSSKSATPQHLATTAVIRRLVGAPATWTESNADITDVRPSPSIPKSIQNLRSLSAEDTTAPQDEHNDTLRQRLGSKIASDVQNASYTASTAAPDMDPTDTTATESTSSSPTSTSMLPSHTTSNYDQHTNNKQPNDTDPNSTINKSVTTDHYDKNDSSTDITKSHADFSNYHPSINNHCITNDSKSQADSETHFHFTSGPSNDDAILHADNHDSFANNFTDCHVFSYDVKVSHNIAAHYTTKRSTARDSSTNLDCASKSISDVSTECDTVSNSNIVVDDTNTINSNSNFAPTIDRSSFIDSYTRTSSDYACNTNTSTNYSDSISITTKYSPDTNSINIANYSSVNDIASHDSFTKSNDNRAHPNEHSIYFTSEPNAIGHSQLDLSPPPSTEPRETQLSRPPTIRRSSNTTNDLTPNTTTIALLGSDSSGQRATRYFFNAVVGLTLVFLAFFHYIAIEPSFLSPDTSTGAFMAPNSWELSLFVSLMQIAALISCASVDVPHAIFVMLTDSFSWLNFLVGGTAKRSQQQQRRRLEAVAATSYDPFGLVQFALRVNIMERDLFIHAWTFFFIVIGALLVAMIAASFLTQSTARKEGLPSRTFVSDALNTVHQLKQVRYRIQGFLVWFLTMAVLPLSAFSMYEVGQDSQSLDGFGSISGILALIALLAIAALILYAAVAVYRTSEVDLSKYKTKIMFGVLYGNYKYESRLFFAATLCVHMLTGVLLAGVVEPSAQMILLLALHGFYLAIMLLLRPHVTTLQLAFSADAELVILVIFGLVHAMTLANRTDEQTKKALAYAVVILVCIVILLVFGRCLLRLWMYLIHDNYEAETSGNQPLAALISSNYWFEEGRETPSLVLSGAMDPHFLSEI